MTLDPGLYVAATPIGNLGDASHRLIDTMKMADKILCEDTRQTAKLCAAYGVETPRAPYHEHNGERVRPGIIEALKDGAAYCLVSDAGTPLISDPGYKLIREARDEGVNIFAIPGPSALIAALSIAGAPTDRFFFAGFPPAKAGARAKFLMELSALNASLVFYETAPRLSASLRAMAEIFGDRPAAIARELTKIHEAVREGNLSLLAANNEKTPAKGEIVVIVHPPAVDVLSAADMEEFLRNALKSMTVKDAAAAAAGALGAPRNEAYDRALKIKKEMD